MKVIGIVLVLCLAGAMGQTTVALTQVQCVLANIVEISQLGNGCLNMTSFIPGPVSRTVLHS